MKVATGKVANGRLDLLLIQPDIGRRVPEASSPDVRRFYHDRIRYWVYYRVRGNRFEVLSVWHANRGRNFRVSKMTPNLWFRQVDVSMTTVILPAMKTAVSIPDRVFQSAEKLAARLGVSRSELYARALAALVEQHREDIVTSKLNELYGHDGEDSSLEKELGLLQVRSIPREK